MLRLYERIGEALQRKQLDVLAPLCHLVKPFSRTEGQLFQFDLFELDARVIERLETLLDAANANANGQTAASKRLVTTATATAAAVVKQSQLQHQQKRPSSQTGEFAASNDVNSDVTSKLQASKKRVVKNENTIGSNNKKDALTNGNDDDAENAKTLMARSKT